MNIRILIFCVASMGISINGIAANKTSPYASIGVTNLKYDGPTVNFRNTLIEGRVGINITPNFAIEGRAATALSDDTVLGTDVEIDNYFGIYLRGNVALGKNASLYGFGGVTNVSAKASSGGLSVRADDSDFSFGVGLDFKVGGNGSIGLEYINMYSNDSEDVTGINIHYKHSF